MGDAQIKRIRALHEQGTFVIPLSMVAHAALLEAARELLEAGTCGYWDRAAPALAAIRSAFSDSD